MQYTHITGHTALLALTGENTQEHHPLHTGHTNLHSEGTIPRTPKGARVGDRRDADGGKPRPYSPRPRPDIPYGDILWLFLLTRGLLVLATYFGYILLTQDKYSSAPVDLSTLISNWNQWDAKRYLNIALRGYDPAAYDLAFFPLFPLLILMLGYPFGQGSYLIMGMLLSNLALLGTLCFLYTLAEELGGERTARRTILYLCIFPTAFFFFTAYNESLFLFFTLGGFLALRRQRWWLAGLAGGLSALTRSTGAFFIVPFLYELWVYRQQVKTNQGDKGQHHSDKKRGGSVVMEQPGSAQGPHPSTTPLPTPTDGFPPIGANIEGTRCSVAPSDRKGRDGANPSSTHLRVLPDKMCRRGAGPLATLAVAGGHGTHRVVKFVLMGLFPRITIPLVAREVAPLMLIPLGTLLYCLYNWQITGNPLAFATVQSHWSRYLSPPWAGIWQNIGQVFWHQPFGSFNQVHSLIDLTMTLGFMALTILGWRKSRMSYNLWLAVVFVYILVTPSIGQADGLISNQRFVLEMFPAFITLALLGQRYPRLHQTILWTFPALLGILSLLFVLGKWMV